MSKLPSGGLRVGYNVSPEVTNNSDPSRAATTEGGSLGQQEEDAHIHTLSLTLGEAILTSSLTLSIRSTPISGALPAPISPIL